MEQLIGLAYLAFIFVTLGMITGAHLMRRLDSMGTAIDKNCDD